MPRFGRVTDNTSVFINHWAASDQTDRAGLCKLELGNVRAANECPISRERLRPSPPPITKRLPSLSIRLQRTLAGAV